MERRKGNDGKKFGAGDETKVEDSLDATARSTTGISRSGAQAFDAARVAPVLLEAQHIAKPRGAAGKPLRLRRAAATATRSRIYASPRHRWLQLYVAPVTMFR